MIETMQGNVTLAHFEPLIRQTRLGLLAREGNQPCSRKTRVARKESGCNTTAMLKVVDDQSINGFWTSRVLVRCWSFGCLAVASLLPRFCLAVFHSYTLRADIIFYLPSVPFVFPIHFALTTRSLRHSTSSFSSSEYHSSFDSSA